MSDIAFRAAILDDVAALHPLIERAYRGETAKAGWTHEADLLFDTRTSAEELSALIADPNRVILLAHKDGALVGCVQVARAGDDFRVAAALREKRGKFRGQRQHFRAIVEIALKQRPFETGVGRRGGRRQEAAIGVLRELVHVDHMGD